MIKYLTQIKCDKCYRSASFDTTDKSVAMLRAMRRGWHITEDQHLCPRCAHDNDKADNIPV